MTQSLKTNIPVSKSEAAESLSALVQINESVKPLYRGPIWLLMLLSLSFGVLVFSHCMSEVSEAWVTVESNVFLLCLVLAVLQWFINRKAGVRVRMYPKTFAGRMMWFGFVIFVMTLMILGSVYTKQGYLFTPYIAGVLASTVLGYLSYNYPTIDKVSSGV